MRTIETKVYKFDKLSEAAKEKALGKLWDINVAYDWWDYIYDDAKMIGCIIHEFDLGRSNYCRLTCVDAYKTAGLIMENHGEECGTYKLAAAYLQDRKHGRPYSELDPEFKRALGEEYLSLLRQEYEYSTSEDAIIETIKANDYEFTEDGRIF